MVECEEMTSANLNINREERFQPWL